MGIADEIMVMHEGRIVARFARGEATPEMIVARCDRAERAGGRAHEASRCCATAMPRSR